MAVALAMLRSSAPPLNPAMGIACYYGRRFRWVFHAVVAELCVLAVGAQVLALLGIQTTWPWEHAPGFDGLRGAIVVITVFASMTGMGALTTPFGKTDPSLYTLPVRSATLASWLISYAAALAAIGWIAFDGLVWQPMGLGAPILWPAAMLAGSIGFGLAASWLPTRWSALWTLVSCGAQIALFVAGPTAAYFGVAPMVITVGYLGVLAVSFPFGIAGLDLARRGECVGAARRIRMAPTMTVTIGPPFRSPLSAQVWMEWRGSGLGLPAVAAALSLLAVIVSALMRWFILIPLGTDDPTPVFGTDIQTQEGTGLLISIVMLSGPYLATLVAFPSTRHRSARLDDGSLGLFYATRPLTIDALVEAKLRAAALSTLLTAAAVLPALALCMLWPAVDGRGHAGVLGLLLVRHAARVADWRMVVLAALALCGIAIITWRAQVETLCIDLIGRLNLVIPLRTAQATLPSILYMVGAIAVSSPTEALWLKAHLALLIGIAAGLKITVAVVLLLVQVRKGIAGARPALCLAAVCIAVYGALLGALLAVLPAGILPRWEIAAALLLILPLIRVSLTPVSLAGNRHR